MPPLRASPTFARYSDGSSQLLSCSADRLADLIFQIDLDAELSGCPMLHLDDNYGDHSVFISAGFVSLMELPLIILKRGLGVLDAEFSNDAGDSID